MTTSARILVIDDDEGLRETVVAVLEMAGYEVVAAEDGEAGMIRASETAPDLVLCDIEMPKKDGFEVLAMFRENASTAHTPFIFLTGKGERELMRRGMDLGADDFITKPFSAEELLSAVTSKLRKHAKQEEAVKRKLDELRLSISSSVPHELKTPLTAILGSGELLLSQGSSLRPEETEELARAIVQSAQRLHQTLEKFWTYTQLLMLAAEEDLRKQLHHGRIQNVDRLVSALADSAAREHHRTQDLRLSLKPADVMMSGHHFSQMLQQVLDNAFKFSTGGAAVEVTMEEDGEHRQTVLQIHDEGRGMKPDQIKRLEGFVQFGRNIHEQQGLGLGLAIAHKLASLYGGNLLVESRPNQGTTVTIRLPAGR
jgi:signal transduction histidine kinase